MLWRQFLRGCVHRLARPKRIVGSRSAVASTALSHNVVQVVPLPPPPPLAET